MRSVPRRSEWINWLAEPRWAIAVLIGFCALHFAIRSLLGHNFTLDESEQMLFTQSLEWGYRFRHPPLITWLSWATLSATGESRFAFFLLKYVLMAAGLVLYYQAARLVIRDNLLAALATIALLSTFSMGYLPLIDLMHTVLLATTLTALLWIVARLVEFGRWRDYLLLGVILALGTLSKYVFVMLPVSLAVGIAFTPGLRTSLRPARLFASFAVAALLIAPFAWWVVHQEQTFFGLAQTATHSVGPTANPLRWLRGTASLAIALVGFVVPSALLFPFLYRRACAPIPGAKADAAAADGNRDWQRAYLITMAVGSLAMLGAVFLVGTTSFKTRWMHEIALPFFIWFFLRVRLAGATPGAHRKLLDFALGFAVLVVLTRIGIFAFHARDCDNCRDYWPMQTYAQGLRQAGFDHGTIVAPRFALAGNLRYVMPEARLVVPGYPPSVFGPQRSGQCAIAWDGGGEPPARMMRYLAETLGVRPGPDAIRGKVTGTLATTKDRPATMSYILIPGGAGLCR
jgi:4-amino-4-deoxy-L-arabinose transferase-like glycosyltransferase